MQGERSTRKLPGTWTDQTGNAAGQNSRATSKPTDKDHSKALRMAQYSGDPSNQRAIQEFRFETLEPTVVEHAAPVGRARGSNIGSSSAGTPRNDWWHSGQHRPLRFEVWPQTGTALDIVIKTDIGAALGVVNRRGVGKAGGAERDSKSRV